jgi:hypothetical protein
VILLNGNIPSEKIPYLLQRAKIIIDLGMPGPERIASEGILFGVIPILSNRWNGISSVDFPIKYKIDLFNFSKEQILFDFLSPSIDFPSTTTEKKKVALVNHQLTEMIQHILDNYNEEIKEFTSSHPFSFGTDSPSSSSASSSSLLSHSTYFSYILSMDQRLINTANLFFSSSKLSITLVATSLKEEYLTIFQILSLLHFYPLCSIDLFVLDFVWFMKHHYSFIDLMIQSGYIRYDLHDPRDHSAFERQSDEEPIISFLNIYSLFELPCLSSVSSSQKMKQTKQWKSLSLFLPIGYLPRNPSSLYNVIQEAEKVEKNKRIVILNEQEEELIEVNGGTRRRIDGRQIIVMKFPISSDTSDLQFFLFYDIIKTIIVANEKSILPLNLSSIRGELVGDVRNESRSFSYFISFYKLTCDLVVASSTVFNGIGNKFDGRPSLSKNSTEDYEICEEIDDMIYDILQTPSWLMMKSFMEETIGIDSVCNNF